MHKFYGPAWVISVKIAAMFSQQVNAAWSH